MGLVSILFARVERGTRGLRLWGWSLLIFALGMSLVALRGQVPDFVGVVIGDTVLVAAAIPMLRSVRKEVNDTLGHDVGDSLLLEIARRLSACVRAGDTVSRPGGDEFVIVLPEIAHAQSATLVAEKIMKAVRQPVCIADHLLDVTVSVGIAVYEANAADDATELMKKADIAMYAAKQAGRNGYRLFEEAIA